MATKKTHGKSHSGRPITDELVVKLCDKAGAGVDVQEIESRRGGRPPMGSAPASVESVRLDPELRQADLIYVLDSPELFPLLEFMAPRLEWLYHVPFRVVVQLGRPHIDRR